VEENKFKGYAMKIIAQKDVINSVTIKNGYEVVKSDVLAKVFARTHKQVLALIRKKIEFFEGNNLSLKSYFIEEEWVDSKNKNRKRYYLTKKGFDYIALSLKGKKAELYKIWYIDAFYDKQRVIQEQKITSKLNHDDDLWKQFRSEGIVYRHKLTEAIRDNIVKYRIEVEKKQNDGRYYQHFTDLVYSRLGIELPKAVNPRDVLDKRMLVKLEDMEDKVADLIEKYSNDGMHYKEIYKKIKADIGSIA